MDKVSRLNREKDSGSIPDFGAQHTRKRRTYHESYCQRDAEGQQAAVNDLTKHLNQFADQLKRVQCERSSAGALLSTPMQPNASMHLQTPAQLAKNADPFEGREREKASWAQRARRRSPDARGAPRQQPWQQQRGSPVQQHSLAPWRAP